MSVAAGTDRRSSPPDQATRGGIDRATSDGIDTPPTQSPVTTRLVHGPAEPFPYTKIRDWIALLPTSELGDGAFRLYYISRSVICENTKGGAPPKTTIEITYEEYAMILGRSARTISRFAQELFAAGLWEEVERAHRSIRIPGKARPEVRTVLTVRVQDFPSDPWAFAGPVKTWDVLSAVRDSKHTSPAHTANVASARTVDETVDETIGGTVGPGGAGPSTAAHDTACETTTVSPQSDQATSPRVDPSECDPTNLSPQSDTTYPQDQPQATSPAQTTTLAGHSETTSMSVPRTDLSNASTISAGHTACDAPLKKGVKEEKPSLPPTPSTADRDSLADELALFSTPTIQLVGHLYDKTLTTNGLQPLSAAERVGLARRIESRLAEGWSLSRVRAVLTGGSLVGVKMPGRLWAGRLDDMPAPPEVPAPRSAPDNATTVPTAFGRRRAGGERRVSAIQTNDCSLQRDPNAGRSRYEIPEGRGVRMAVRWADSDRVPPWCGRCSSDARTLRPAAPGGLPRPCLECHPDPHAFPPPDPDPADTATAGAQAPTEAPGQPTPTPLPTTPAAATTAV